MVDRKRNVLPVVALLIGASGLAFGMYSVLFPSPDTSIVAIWENVSGSGDDFYLNISENQLTHTEYSSLADANTSINLLQTGWYKFNLKFILGGLLPTDSYEFTALKNGALLEGLYYIPGPQSTFWTVNVVLYVLSDGDDVINFRWYSHDYDTFSVAINQAFNQIVLEYV